MNKANKILIPRNPDDTISLPPYVDFRHPDDIRETQPRQQEGRQ